MDEGRYVDRVTTRTRHGTLTSRRQYHVEQPSWVVERPIKRLDQRL